jgi:HSP20 family protein
LTIRGNRNLENRHAESGYSRVERISGSFYRQLTLPGHIDSSKIQAKSKNGVLEVIIPKTEKSASKRIEVMDK